MKIFPCLLTLVCLTTGHLLAAGAASVEELRATLQDAVTEHKIPAIRDLYYAEGMTNEDIAATERPLHLALSEGTVTDVIVAPLPPGFQTSTVALGLKTELLHAPQGLISLAFTDMRTGLKGLSLPYAQIDGRYYLIGTRVTDLQWQGPRDQSLGYTVNGPGQHKITVLVKWNASGVDLEYQTDAAFATLLGQHFNEVIVTSTDSAADLILTLRDKSGIIFTSAPLKGEGEIRYRRE
jgi:hypothetical protein